VCMIILLIQGKGRITIYQHYPSIPLSGYLYYPSFFIFQTKNVGFITVTYILKGGLVHRDSLGVKQTYGAETRHDGKHTQWLTAGAGVLHEEMWDIQQPGMFFKPSPQELFQLWLNLPARDKMISPKVQLLGGEEETPTVITMENSNMNTDEDARMTAKSKNVENDKIATKTIVIAGEHSGKRGSVVTQTDVSILHVQIMEPNVTWTHILPESHKTAIIYVRRGSIYVGEERVPAHYTAYLKSHGTNLSVTSDPKSSSKSNNDQPIADFILLAGEPINEPIMPQGSMVMNYPNEINQAYQDYQTGKMGIPWDHTVSDEDWKAHTERYPSFYKEGKDLFYVQSAVNNLKEWSNKEDAEVSKRGNDV